MWNPSSGSYSQQVKRELSIQWKNQFSERISHVIWNLWLWDETKGKDGWTELTLDGYKLMKLLCRRPRPKEMNKKFSELMIYWVCYMSSFHAIYCSTALYSSLTFEEIL